MITILHSRCLKQHLSNNSPNINIAGKFHGVRSPGVFTLVSWICVLSSTPIATALIQGFIFSYLNYSHGLLSDVIASGSFLTTSRNWADLIVSKRVQMNYHDCQGPAKYCLVLLFHLHFQPLLHIKSLFPNIHKLLFLPDLARTELPSSPLFCWFSASSFNKARFNIISFAECYLLYELSQLLRTKPNSKYLMSRKQGKN